MECICNGENKKCELCKGHGQFKVYRCPRSFAFDPEVVRIFPYFNTWLVSNFTVFPDGRGRYYQPEILLELFDLILTVYNIEQKRKQKEREANGKQT